MKLFSEKSYTPLGKDHIVMLYPFFGTPPEDSRDTHYGRFNKYAEAGQSFFQMTHLQDANVAVLPGAWEHVIKNSAAIEQAERFMADARQLGKPTVIFFWSDSDEAIPYNDTVVFRTSFHRSCKKATEHAMPAWSEDFIARHLDGRLPLRPKNSRATVGFCGYTATPRREFSPIKQKLRASWRLLKNVVRRSNDKDGHSIRAAAIQALSKSREIETNFVIRERFLGGALEPSGATDYEKLNRVRHEYVQNMVESDYVLCARGAGNFSYRLYETLSCGRIPVFVDTDCVLPYESEIDWHKYCVWINANEVEQIGQKVAAFHETLSTQDFINLQQECRMLWENYISPQGFFQHFHKHFN